MFFILFLLSREVTFRGHFFCFCAKCTNEILLSPARGGTSRAEFWVVQSAQKFRSKTPTFVQCDENPNFCATCTKVFHIARIFCAKRRKIFWQPAQIQRRFLCNLMNGKIFVQPAQNLSTLLCRLTNKIAICTKKFFFFVHFTY